MTWDKAHHYPGSIEYEDIRIALNKVDSWIDMLNANYISKTYKSPTTASSDIPMMWLLQQSLPRMEVPKFNGNPMKWVEFVIKFKELAQDQVYLIVNQRFIFLMQHMDDEAKRAIQVFLTNKNGYILALKRLKYIYICFDISLKLVKHTHPSLQYQISNDDDKSLLEYYYKMSNCVVALKQSNYVYDPHGTVVLRQTIKRLPSIFHYRWTKHCFKIRRHKEPSLTDLESWLQERILASKEASYHDPKKNRNTGSDEKWFGKTTLS